MNKIGAALLILLLLPAVVAEWEGRRLPDIFHAVLAVAGLLVALALGGTAGLIIALFVGLSCLALLGILVAATQSFWGIRLVTGGNIKLLAAGATWLTPLGALLMIPLVALLFLAVAALLRARKGQTIRPALSPLAAIVMLAIFPLMNHSNFIVS